MHIFLFSFPIEDQFTQLEKNILQIKLVHPSIKIFVYYNDSELSILKEKVEKLF